MAARLVTSVLVGRRVLPAGTEETPELRRQISKSDLWSGPTELTDDDLRSEETVGAEQGPDQGDADDAVAEAIGAAVAAATEQLREELRAEIAAEVGRQIDELLGSVEPTEVDGQDGAASTPPELIEPPRGGQGSGEPAWRTYAERLGVDVSGVSDRDGIIAAVEKYKATSA